jgi:hypothetical protein
MNKKIVGIIIIILVLAGLGGAYSFRLFNRPPKTDFLYRTPTRSLKYIQPSNEETIIFNNTSTDPDGDPLTFSWFVNGSLQSRNRNFQTKLFPGIQTVRLVANDGKAETVKDIRFAVEQSSVFPMKKLNLPIKGVNYRLDKQPPIEEVAESLAVIHSDLGCNGIKLMSGYDDAILDATKIAIQVGFKEIILNPRFEWTNPRNESFNIEDHIRRIGQFALKANQIVAGNVSIILCIGDELTHSVRGIAEAPTYRERVEENQRIGWKNQAAKENAYLERIITEVRKGFKGKITYASSQGMYKYIEWGRLDIDIIAPHMYFSPTSYTETTFLQDLRDLNRFGKPVYVSEFGCETYVGAAKGGGDAWRQYTNQSYSQEEQASNIDQTLTIFQKTSIQAAYLWAWLEPSVDDGYSYGIVKFMKNGLYERKLGFYTYKSYALQSSSSVSQSNAETNTARLSCTLPLAPDACVVTVPAVKKQNGRENRFRKRIH